MNGMFIHGMDYAEHNPIQSARKALLATIIRVRSVDTPDPAKRRIRFAEYAQAANVLTREDATEEEINEQIKFLQKP